MVKKSPSGTLEDGEVKKGFIVSIVANLLCTEHVLQHSVIMSSAGQSQPTIGR